MTLTRDDLNQCLADERHLGWGYATRRHLSQTKADRLDQAVVQVANELGLTREQLFHWTNSKAGRWLVDEESGGRPDSAGRVLVRRYLNTDELARIEASS